MKGGRKEGRNKGRKIKVLLWASGFWLIEGGGGSGCAVRWFE